MAVINNAKKYVAGKWSTISLKIATLLIHFTNTMEVNKKFYYESTQMIEMKTKQWLSLYQDFTSTVFLGVIDVGKP